MSSRTQVRVTSVSPVSAEVELLIEDGDSYHFDDDNYADDDDNDEEVQSYSISLTGYMLYFEKT